MPSPESPLLVIGDVSSLRVRAEFEERDVGKLRVGQAAIVRSDAFAGQDFEGTVSSLAQALGPSKLGQRGPRRPTDVDVLEVIIDLTGQPPLLPGMRVDVFLKADCARPAGRCGRAIASSGQAELAAIAALACAGPSSRLCDAPAARGAARPSATSAHASIRSARPRARRRANLIRAQIGVANAQP